MCFVRICGHKTLQGTWLLSWFGCNMYSYVIIINGFQFFGGIVLFFFDLSVSICYILEQKHVICWILQLNFSFALSIDFSQIWINFSVVFIECSMVLIDFSIVFIDFSCFRSIFHGVHRFFHGVHRFFHGVHRFFHGFHRFFCIACTWWKCRI